MAVATVTPCQINDLSFQRITHACLSKEQILALSQTSVEAGCSALTTQSLTDKNLCLTIISSTITPATPHTAGFMRLCVVLGEQLSSFFFVLCSR